MGCDIHAVFQKRTDSGWEDVPTQWDEGRHYFLFSVLAGVRNGFGFAGVPTYEPVVPISEPRGLPVDFEVVNESHPVRTPALLGWREKYRDEDEALEIWMGDHSHSWLTADEILEYANRVKASSTERVGVVPIQQYREWDKQSQPDGWSGDVWGNDVVVAESPSAITDKTTHVRIRWVRSTLDEIDYFVKEVQRLKDKHGEVRMVFGFDS